MNMYPAYCNASTLTFAQCDNGDNVFPERECDGMRNDCNDGSDEGSKCLTNPVLSARYGCCRNLVMSANLGFIFPGLTEDVVFNPATWHEQMKRPAYEGSIIDLNIWMLMGGEYSYLYLTPVEFQSDISNCGKGQSITWALYYGKQAGAPVTCEMYSAVRDGSNSDYFFLQETTDHIMDTSYCPMAVNNNFFNNLVITEGDGNEREFRCADVEPTITTTTTSTTGADLLTGACDSNTCQPLNYECVEDQGSPDGYYCTCAGLVQSPLEPCDLCHWDSSQDEKYQLTSNDGNVYDTAICKIPVATADEAAAECAARGARLFQEEVYLFTPESFFSSPVVGGCHAVIQMYAKAHGRLYQISKFDPEYKGKMLTGYRSNADGSNWCWFDGTTCHETESNTPIGVHIESENGWSPMAGHPDCNVPQITAMINNALSAKLALLPVVPESTDDCIAMDYALDMMVVVKCEGGSYDSFSCERLQVPGNTFYLTVSVLLC